METVPLFVLVLFLITFCNFKTEKEFVIKELNYTADLKIQKRAGWGWQALSKVLPEHSIQHITIHHGGEYFTANKNIVSYLRNLQNWSRRKKKWIEIPYHFMIDLQGTIYETRPINYQGDTNTNYDTKGHVQICVMGNYEEQILSEQQRRALVKLCAFLAGHFHVASKEIKGHKDYTETLCPGKDLYRYLEDGTIHREVSKLLGK